MAKSVNDDTTEARRQMLRATFDDQALRYDAVRPGYPAELFDDLIALAGIPPGGRILEIGCGTGQATLPLAHQGFQIDCVELGEQLAAVARQKLAAYPEVTVTTGAFETWPLPPTPYDLVIAATSFHWITPAIAYQKSARALRPGGALGLFWNADVQHEGSDDFFTTVQEVYQREAPELNEEVPPEADKVAHCAPELETTPHFGPVTIRRYRWDADYTATDYVHLLSTYSRHLSLPQDKRDRLFDGIARLIETRYGGKITKGYLAVLYVAHRK